MDRQKHLRRREQDRQTADEAEDDLVEEEDAGKARQQGNADHEQSLAGTLGAQIDLPFEGKRLFRRTQCGGKVYPIPPPMNASRPPRHIL